MYTLALTNVDRSVSYFMTTKRLRQGGIEPPAQLISKRMAKLYFTTKPLALNCCQKWQACVYNHLTSH